MNKYIPEYVDKWEIMEQFSSLPCDIDEMVYDVLYDIKGVESIPNKWIKCSDRMPESYKLVLVLWCNKELCTAFYDEKMNWWQSGAGVVKKDCITYWMPLPNPPESKRIKNKTKGN